MAQVWTLPEASHWLALRTLTVNAHLLANMLGGTPVLVDYDAPVPLGLSIVDMEAFCRWDGARPGSLPASWEVTGDSLAVRLAGALEASEVVLLKSTDMPSHTSWDEASRSGIVDGYFARAVAENARGISLRVMNLRCWHKCLELS